MVCVSCRYATILSEQKKTEASLRWLKRGRQGLSFFGRGSSSAPVDDSTTTTDDDRVKMQMQLDVDTLAKDAEGLGVDVRGSRAFEVLRGAVVNESGGGEKEVEKK